MACLAHFKGWTDTSLEVEASLRDLITKLKLRPLVEPGDVDSVLLRSQIDERYLRAMADARAQLSITGSDSVGRRSNKDQPNRQSQTPEGREKKKGRIPAQPSVRCLSSFCCVVHEFKLFLTSFSIPGSSSNTSTATNDGIFTQSSSQGDQWTISAKSSPCALWVSAASPSLVRWLASSCTFWALWDR